MPVISVETVGVDADTGRRDDEKAPEVNEIAAALAHLAGESRAEVVQVAVDVEHENGTILDKVNPLLTGRRTVQDTEDDSAAAVGTLFVVELVFDRV
jgi:hypothetical protein